MGTPQHPHATAQATHAIPLAMRAATLFLRCPRCPPANAKPLTSADARTCCRSVGLDLSVSALPRSSACPLFHCQRMHCTHPRALLLFLLSPAPLPTAAGLSSRRAPSFALLVTPAQRHGCAVGFTFNATPCRRALMLQIVHPIKRCRFSNCIEQIVWTSSALARRARCRHLGWVGQPAAALRAIPFSFERPAQACRHCHPCLGPSLASPVPPGQGSA